MKIENKVKMIDPMLHIAISDETEKKTLFKTLRILLYRRIEFRVI